MTSRAITSTIFLDPPTMRHFLLDECIRQMLAHGGLGRFFEKGAPTYRSWTQEFLTTFMRSNNREAIKFRLSGTSYTLSFVELDNIFGITAAPTDYVWDAENRHYDFWQASTGEVFNTIVTQYNYKWSHPCLRIVHKVIRMAFLGHVEVNKVHTTDLQCMWSMTADSPYIPDWKDLFMTACAKATVNKPGGIAIGGMITLIGDYLRLPRPAEQPVQRQYSFVPDRLRHMHVIRTVRPDPNSAVHHHYYIFGPGQSLSYRLPRPQQFPYPDRYIGWMMRHLAVADQPEIPPAAPPVAPQVQIEPPVYEQAAADMEHEDEESDWGRLAWERVQSLDQRFTSFQEQQEQQWKRQEEQQEQHWHRQDEQMLQLMQQMQTWDAFARSHYPDYPPPPQ